MTQALFVGRLQEPGTEVAVNLDARSGDSLGQIPQSSRLSVPLCHIFIHTPLWTRGQPQLRESTLPTAIRVRPREATEAVRVRSSSGPPSLASPPPRLPVNPLFLSSAQQAADVVRPVNGYLAGSRARTGQSTGSRATRLGCWCWICCTTSTWIPARCCSLMTSTGSRRRRSRSSAGSRYRRHTSGGLARRPSSEKR